MVRENIFTKLEIFMKEDLKMIRNQIHFVI
jgi:hypothetical protein